MRKIILILCILVLGCLNQAKKVDERSLEYFVVPADGSCPKDNKSLEKLCQLIETPQTDFCNDLPRRGMPKTDENRFDQIDCLITLAAYKKTEEPCRFLVGDEELLCTAAANKFSAGCNAIGDEKIRSKCEGYLEQVEVYERLDKIIAYRH